jgi:thiamine-monophosphate kinase
VGPGDDAAVLEGGWVVSTDLTVEDVHFRRLWLTDVEIGYRAAAAALSDLAAMAARPVGALVSLAIPAGDGFEAARVSDGVREAVEGVGGTILGGDLSRSPGPLMLDVVVIGRTSRPVARAGAEPGDEVWVTGSLGGSAAAVRVWTSGGEPPGSLRSLFARPTPRIDVARRLAASGTATALIDLSDGLAGDAGHLAAASGVAVVLEGDRIPVHPDAVGVFGETVALELALHGGEDYELCFTARPGTVDRSASPPMSRVGRVVEGSGVSLEGRGGSVAELTRGGFDHLGGGTG